MPGKSNIDISVTDRSVRLSKKKLEELVRFVLRSEGHRPGHIDIAIVGPGEMAGHNRRFLNHAGATDVISFDLSSSDVPGISAQIIICGAVARTQAKLRGLKPSDELMLYLIHGLLHMTGHDDTSVRAGARMSARQEELLREFTKT